METKEDYIKKIGSNIRRARKSIGLSMEKLALEAGIEYSQVSRIEGGKINTSIFELYLISTALEVHISEFFTW